MDRFGAVRLWALKVLSRDQCFARAVRRSYIRDNLVRSDTSNGCIVTPHWKQIWMFHGTSRESSLPGVVTSSNSFVNDR